MSFMNCKKHTLGLVLLSEKISDVHGSVSDSHLPGHISDEVS